MTTYHFPSVRTDGLTLILGLGETGVAAATWCLDQGAQIRIADTRESSAAAQELASQHPQSVALSLGDDALHPDVLRDVHTVVLSPGLSPLQQEVKQLLLLAEQQGISVINEIELFALALADLKKQHHYTPTVFAITGTNGKTTVTALIRHMLESAGLHAVSAGNISPAAISALSNAVAAGQLPDAWVIELSSFQLHSVRSLQADVACVLNISQDHLDWHGSFDAYQAAKARIFDSARLKVVNRDDSATLAMINDIKLDQVRSFGAETPTFDGDLGLCAEQSGLWLCAAETSKEHITEASQGQRLEGSSTPLMPTEVLRIRGQHNVLNALAALTMCRSTGLAWEPLLLALRDYSGEPHRVEYVRTIRGVSFINDSKGTNVGSTVAALTGLDQRVVLIVGGLGKGQDFRPLVDAVQRAEVVALVLLGASAPELAQVLAVTAVPQFVATDMANAVHIAFTQAAEGDLVLLSPACASMDMFDSYVHRGNVFMSEVTELALENGEVA